MPRNTAQHHGAAIALSPRGKGQSRRAGTGEGQLAPRFDTYKGGPTYAYRVEFTPVVPRLSVRLPKVDIFEYKMRHFVEVCRDGRSNESSGEHGLMVQKMLDGVYRSAAAGKEVAIK